MLPRTLNFTTQPYVFPAPVSFLTGDGVPNYQIFTGFYDWHNGDWEQSAVQNVAPGDKIFGFIVWNAATSTYTQTVALAGGAPIATKVSVKMLHGEVFTDAYFVVEHQPNTCKEYPANGGIQFDDISIVWANGAPLTTDSWTVAQFQPACNSKGAVKSASSIAFTWDTV